MVPAGATPKGLWNGAGHVIAAQYTAKQTEFEPEHSVELSMAKRVLRDAGMKAQPASARIANCQMRRRFDRANAATTWGTNEFAYFDPARKRHFQRQSVKIPIARTRIYVRGIPHY